MSSYEGTSTGTDDTVFSPAQVEALLQQMVDKSMKEREESAARRVFDRSSGEAGSSAASKPGLLKPDSSN